MTFYSNFSDRDGKRYEIELQCTATGGEADITLGGNPCIINVSSNGLFSPIKSRSCSIEVVSDEYYLELYEPTSRGTKVKVYEYDSTAVNNVGKVIFRGYLTPCSYDQTFTYLDTITLECVDAISTAKDFKYNALGKYVTFFDAVIGILKSAGYQGSLYVPRTYSYVNETQMSSDVLQSLYVSDYNFIDDDEEKTRWDEYTVLEEILKFLNWSLIPDGDDVWLMDYRAEGITHSAEYSKYDIQSGVLTSTFTSSSSPVNINLSKITGGTSNLSIDDMYNKIQVSDNLYKIEDLAADIFDDKGHISVTDEAALGFEEGKWTKTKTSGWLWWKNSTEILTGYDYQTFCRLNPSTGWTHKYYRISDLTPLDNSDGKGYFDQTTYNDGNWTYRANAINTKLNTHGCLIQHYAHIKNQGENNIPASIEWNDYLTFFILGPTTIPFNLVNVDNFEKEVLEYNINEEINWKPKSGTSWITIKGDLFYQYGDTYKSNKKKEELTIINADKNFYVTFPVDQAVDGLPTDKKYIECFRRKDQTGYGKGFSCWKMKLQIGEGAEAKYWYETWNPSTGVYTSGWTSIPSYFYLRYNNDPDGENDEYIPLYQWVSTVNSHSYKDKVGVDGYCIPIASDDPTAPSKGKLKLSVCSPSLVPQELLQIFRETWPEFYTSCGWSTKIVPVVYAKDFEIGYVYTDTDVWYNSHDDNNNADKVYTGYINDNFVQDFSNIELKINTASYDQPISRSYVTTSNGYLSKMKHVNSLTAKEQEYNIIDAYLDHFSERKVILEFNMKDYQDISKKYVKDQFSNDIFLIDTQSWDVAAKNNRVKFISF